MNFKIVTPTGFLNNYIKHYCFMESEINSIDVVERVIPTENIQLMFHYKMPFVVFHPNNTITKQPRSILSGLNDSFSDVSTNGETGVVFIEFRPAGACNFFNFPLSEIENKSVDLSDIFTSEIMLIEEQLSQKKSIQERITIIENFLIKRFSPIPIYDSILVEKGINIIKAQKGQINTSLLSSKLSLTTKTLERKFSQYLGKTTKQIIKLIRFQEVLKDFSINKKCSLSDYAYKNGYFDQSHFIRDFKSYSGYTPKEFVARYPDYTVQSDFC